MKLFVFVLIFLLSTPLLVGAERPNIVWIVIEDASPHIGCYGETAIKTPAIDGLASDGIRFTQAFVTASVCSPSRSAMVSGMYQMSLGAHNHRSQNSSGKGGTSAAYFESYKVPATIKLVPELFRDAGYYVTNKSKTDYNFIPRSQLYHGKDWKKANPDQPIFAQFQLKGGKRRGPATHVELDKIQLPPYYADHPDIRNDWARYLESWWLTDQDVANILADLEKAGRLENTAIFLWTDHGVSHLRGKQFLYEEGIHVPLIVRLPGRAQSGTERHDIVEHIDIAATSLAIAGLPVPEAIQGRDFLATGYTPRNHLFSGRDRCDETVDIIRAIRDDRFKYIRNFMSHVGHAQPNQYKDGKKILQTMRKLHSIGKLNQFQAKPFADRRLPEELYDLENDPHELNNLAASPEHSERLNAMRGILYGRMKSERDMGLVPEPILEDIGRRSGSKYAAFVGSNREAQTQKLIETITAGEQNDTSALLEFARSQDPSVRYWAAVWLGVNKVNAGRSALQSLVADDTPAVRVAAAQALVKLGDDTHLEVLADHINDPNLLVGMFALRAIEELGDLGRSLQSQIAAAHKSEYEFSRRIAKRLTNKWKNQTTNAYPGSVLQGYKVEKLLHQDDFDGDLSAWQVEQVEGGTTEINDRALEINDAKGCTIWFREKMTASVLIEYDITMIDQGGPHDRTSDLNCFAMAVDPNNPDDLLAGGEKRGGSFKNYHPLRLYYVGYGANKNRTARFRRYPGGGARPVLPEHDLKASHIPNQVRHVQIISANGEFKYLIDGESVFDFKDPEPFTSGWFGFRTVRNHMKIDRFRVWRVSKEK